MRTSQYIPTFGVILVGLFGFPLNVYVSAVSLPHCRFFLSPWVSNQYLVFLVAGGLLRTFRRLSLDRKLGGRGYAVSILQGLFSAKRGEAWLAGGIARAKGVSKAHTCILHFADLGISPTFMIISGQVMKLLSSKRLCQWCSCRCRRRNQKRCLTATGVAFQGSERFTKFYGQQQSRMLWESRCVIISELLVLDEKYLSRVPQSLSRQRSFPHESGEEVNSK
jgi:hypothetical protein